MKLYSLAYKLHIVSDVTDETYRQVSTALAESRALYESEQVMLSLEDSAQKDSAAQQ
jgi:hypothetical protein